MGDPKETTFAFETGRFYGKMHDALHKVFIVHEIMNMSHVDDNTKQAYFNELKELEIAINKFRKTAVDCPYLDSSYITPAL